MRIRNIVPRISKLLTDALPRINGAKAKMLWNKCEICAGRGRSYEFCRVARGGWQLVVIFEVEGIVTQAFIVPTVLVMGFERPMAGSSFDCY